MPSPYYSLLIILSGHKQLYFTDVFARYNLYLVFRVYMLMLRSRVKVALQSPRERPATTAVCARDETTKGVYYPVYRSCDNRRAIAN